MKIGTIAALIGKSSHLVVRKEGIMCTRCYVTDPVHPGESGTPMPSLVYGYVAAVKRHNVCVPIRGKK